MTCILGITPARGGSKGIPRKNIKLLAGAPLISYTIKTAQNCAELTDYVVNSEDKEISDYAISLGVLTQSRPREFWYDNTFQEVDRLLCWSVSEFEATFKPVDIVVLLYPTSPLRPSTAISDCIKLITEKGYDSSLTLYESRSYIWEKVKSTDSSSLVAPVNYKPSNRGPNQLEGWNQWIENKAVYAVRRDLLMSTKCRLGGQIGFVEMMKHDSIDIDTISDFTIAEQLLNARQNIQ